MKMKHLAIAAALTALALGISGVALAGRGDAPAPEKPIRFRPEHKGAARHEEVSDDPAGHDAGDDHGGDRPEGVSDDPAGHEAGDDHGGDD